MSRRMIILGVLIFSTLVIPIVQLSFGFHYINTADICRLQPDIMLLMALGGVFEAIFFAAAFGFLCNVTPSKYKQKKAKTAAQATAQGSNRASKILIGKPSFTSESLRWTILIHLGCIVSILGACAVIFFVLLQLRVYSKFGKWDSTNSSADTYCVFPLFSAALGLVIATYLAFIFIFIVAFILLCGIGARQQWNVIAFLRMKTMEWALLHANQLRWHILLIFLSEKHCRFSLSLAS